MVWSALIMFSFRLIEFRPISPVYSYNITRKRLILRQLYGLDECPAAAHRILYTSDYHIDRYYIDSFERAVKLVDLLSNQTEYMAENIRIISSILATFSLFYEFWFWQFCCVDIFIWFVSRWFHLRYLVIVYPMKSRSFCTLHNCRRALIAVWIFALLLTAPSVWARVGLCRPKSSALYILISV